jgi:hypothetical protein
MRFLARGNGAMRREVSASNKASYAKRPVLASHGRLKGCGLRPADT